MTSKNIPTELCILDAQYFLYYKSIERQVKLNAMDTLCVDEAIDGKC